MSIINGYDSDEEFSFFPSSGDWEATDPILIGSKPLRDDYRLLECIGRGSYSCVYKVENIHTGNIECAKNYFPQQNDSNEYLDLSSHAAKEISMLRSLTHPSILPINGIYRGRRRGSVYLITDLYDTTLDEILRFHITLTEDEIRCILREILDVLVYIHSKGIIHCDLKPGNILFHNGKIALCDWGSATFSTVPSQVPTLGYCAPELLLWKKDMDPSLWTTKIDIWGFGVIALELLTNKYLIESESEIAALNRAVKTAGLMNLSDEEKKQYDYCIKHSFFQFNEVPDSIDDLAEGCSSGALEVLHSCLRLMPAGRKSAMELMACSWLNDCMNVSDLPDLFSSVKEKRNEAKKKNLEMWQEFQRMLQESQ